jgi:uncharacterized membrane protein
VKRNTQYPIPNTLLLLTLLLAWGLRSYKLDAQSLWYDEAVTAHVAAQGIAELTRWTAEDIQPPLYYYVVAGWTRLTGRSEWALRFPSAFFGVLTVPLLWAVARRLFGRGRLGRPTALIAALLTAISPLYVYYAQEARMYTQLTFLGALAGYALLRAVTTNDERPTADGIPRSSLYALRSTLHASRWWIAFGLVATAMLYTHYFGAFLLLAYALCFAAAWVGGIVRAGRGPDPSGLGKPEGSGGHRPFGFGKTRRVWRAALSALAILLLYLPWLPAMLTRYRVDRSYWQGSLKLGEALRHVAISFTVAAPETMLERDAVRLLPWFGLVFGLAVVALLWWGGRGQRMETDKWIGKQAALVYLSTCLLVPLLLVLALASRTPKFNARYLMLVSPAYLLILAGGIGDWGLGIRYWILHIRRSNTQYLIPVILSGALTIFLAATSITSLHNWFTAPAFTKAQWRELAATVRAQRQPDEAVLLISGHAWPAWDYYAPDVPRARLPDLDILDVDAVLGFNSGARLEQALAGKAGAWLVLWQADAVDPVGFVPYFLDRAGAEQPVARQFWHLKLRHWRLRADAVYPSEPRPAHPDAANYAHQIALLGWDDPQAGQLTVYWRALNTITRDYQVSLTLEDAAGQEIGRWDGRPAGYDYPTFRWRPGQALFGRYPLPVPAGALAGDYYVTLVLYDTADPAGLDIMDVADNPAGKRVRLGPMRMDAGR